MPISLISERILEDAKKESKRILNEANGAAESIAARAKEQGEALVEARLVEARRNLADEKRERLARAGLESRDAVISAKQELIHDAFKAAGRMLEEIDDTEYVRLMAGLITKNAGGGDEVILDRRYAALNRKIIDSANTQLSKKRKKPVKMVEGGHDMGRGLIMRRDRIEINYRFDLLLQEARADFEGDAAKIIFEDQK